MRDGNTIAAVTATDSSVVASAYASKSRVSSLTTSFPAFPDGILKMLLHQ